MAIIDWLNPDPERGIFGCFYAAMEYMRAKSKLPQLDAAVTSLAKSVDRLLNRASGTYYTSSYGPGGPFRDSARKSIEDLERITERITQFVEDMRENFLRESEPQINPISFFISYSHADRKFAARFAEDLREHGHTVWRDEDSVMLGEPIRRSIEEGISGSRFIIALIS